MSTVKQISDNEIYLLIKYIKSVLWRVEKHQFCTEDARCLKVKINSVFSPFPLQFITHKSQYYWMLRMLIF